MLVRHLPCILFLIALLPRAHGVAYAGDGASTPDWTRPAPIPGETAPRAETFRVPGRVEVGEIAAIDGPVRLERGGAEAGPLQVGDAVLVGDLVEVGPGGALELTFGLNARLRLGESSRLRVQTLARSDEDAEVVRTERDMRLDRGTARVRVRLNTRTPSPVYLVTGEATFHFERCDAVVDLREEASSLTVLNGEARVDRAVDGAAGARALHVEESQQVSLSKEGEDGAEIASMTPEELERIRGSVAFSVEEARAALPLRPVGRGESEGGQ
jgi:hypothetical protein